MLDTLRSRAAQSLTAEGFGPDEHEFVGSADLRYYGQAFEVRVPVSVGSFDEAAADDAVAAFHDAHELLYGYCFRDRPEQQVEWVNLRVTGVGSIRRPALRAAPTGTPSPPTGERPVCFEVGADGCYTGRLAGTLCYGPGKLEQASRFAAERGETLAASAFYTDSASDLPVLEAVGAPVAVNPDPRLRRVASKRGWPVVDWGEPA